MVFEVPCAAWLIFGFHLIHMVILESSLANSLTGFIRLARFILYPYVYPPSSNAIFLTLSDGGFLQTGSANDCKPVALISETSFNAIVVSPGYRLNIFGFLASPDLIKAGCDPNCGLWDQRLALQLLPPSGRLPSVPR